MPETDLGNRIFSAAVADLRRRATDAQSLRLIQEAFHIIAGPDTDVDHRDWIREARRYLGGVA